MPSAPLSPLYGPSPPYRAPRKVRDNYIYYDEDDNGQAMTNRKEQQAELLLKFGALIAPMEELIDYPDQQNAQTQAKASAKFTHDRESFQHMLDAFTRGEAGHNYKIENSEISGRLNRFTNQMVSFRNDTEKLRNELLDLRKTLISNILAIPCELDSAVLEAGSPFTAFVKIRSICETASQELVFIDPYMGQGTVRRYFHGIPEQVTVTVITKRRSGDEFLDFLDASKLYADERGQSRYCLLYHPDLHDRYLQCDETVYHLGGSLKDAGRKSNYTISRIMVASDGAAAVVKLLEESTEQFGLHKSNHPQT